MSADDFQTKYASVMESMLKSAVAETTKLFETMVDELKAEISRIKKENEDLKTKCSQFEHERSQTIVYMRQSEAPAGRSAETRDTAVQCELVPFRTILVEQCQPLRPPTLQNQKQQCSHEETEYVLQEHNYDSHGAGNSQMAFMLVKQASVLKQKDDEATVVCKQVLSHKADSQSASVGGIEIEGKPFMKKVCSTREIPSPQRHEETQVAQELPLLATISDLQGAPNQSSEIEDSLVISLAAIKDDIEDESEVSQKISEIGAHGEIMTSEKDQLVVASPQLEVEPLEKEQPSVVSQECQTEVETSVNEKTGVTLQKYEDVQSTQEQFPQPIPFSKGEACDEFKKDLAENEASSQPDLPVRHRRGRAPKKAKPLQQPVKGICQLPSGILIGREVKKSATIRVEEAGVSSAVDTVNIISSGAPHACRIQPKESLSIITPSIQERLNTALEVVENSKDGSQAVSVASLRRRCYSEREKPSECQQLSIDMKEAATQTTSTKVCSAIRTLNSPPAACPQAPSIQPRERLTSVTLQDAILLVEAMNQSGVDDTSSSLQRMASTLQTQCARHVGALQTVDKVPAEPQTLPLPVETHEAVDNLPITALPRTTDANPTNAAQAHIKVDKQKQQCTTTPSVPPSTAAIQISVQSLLQHRPHTLITSVAPIRRGNTALHKIIVIPRSLSSLMPHKIVKQPLTQIPPVMSTVVAAQNNSILPGSTAADLTLKTLPLSSVPQTAVYVKSSKSLPVVTQSTTTSTDVRSGTLRLPKKTIIIPRQMPAKAPRKQQSQTIVLTAQQESTQSDAPVMVSSSQELNSSVGTHTALGEVTTDFSQKRDSTPDNLESPKQTPSVSETNAHTEICSSLKMSAGPVPNSESLTEPLTFEQNLSTVIRLTRLPFQMSTKESVLVSRLPANGYSDSQSILKKGATQEKSSSVVISTQPSETLVLSTDICPSLTETSVDVSVNTSEMPEEQNDIQEKASLSSENCTILEESPNSGYVQPSAPPKMLQPVFEKSTMAINRTKPSSVSGTAGEPTSSLDEEINCIAEQDYTLTNSQPIEEKQSAALIHLTSITCKDTSDPHLQMTKTQFLAQLAVSPVPQNPEKASSNDYGDARASCAGTSISDKKDSLMAQLRSHIKTHLKARRTKTNPEPGTETETCTVSPKKPRLENDHPNDNNTTSEPTPLSPKNPRTAENITSLKRTTNDATPTSHRNFQQCKDDVKPKRTVKESFSVSSRSPKATNEFTPVSARRSTSDRDDVGSKNRKSTSVSPRQSSSTKESTTPKNTRNTSMRPRRISSTRDGASPKLTKTGGSPNHTKTTSVRRKRTSMSRDSASPKKTKTAPVSPRISGLCKNDTNSKISTNESTSVSSRKCTVTKDDSSTKQIKRESNSFSPKCSKTPDGAGTKNTMSETDSPGVRWPKLAKDGVSSRKSVETTSVTKARLSQDGTSGERNLRVANAKKLAKAAKVKTIAKMKNSNQSKLQNGAETSQLAQNSASCEDEKKRTAKAVWTPPRMPTGKTSPVGEKKSHLSVKKGTRSQDRTVVYPPSVSLHPIPVKAPPVVSPLQPLSVIGWRLLKNQCGECGRVLSSSAALESHVSLHKGRRPFSCMLCGKRFPDSKGLKRHGRVHRNGRIHICQTCGKGFVYRFCLTKHIQMVHSKIKPFVCQICDKGFFTKRDVENHIRLHTGEKPFHCNLCEKKFARRVELNVHLRWHNGEKRHWCPYCGKGFLDFNNLKRHKYIHTGEKPHSCPHCPKNFTQSGHLKKHVKNVHKIP